MKKHFLIISLIVFVLTLVGCGFSVAPIISLNGNETVYVEYEGEYLELGATYEDNHDDPGNAVIGGDIVDSSVLGTYIITYNITDSNKNEALEVIRTVIVEDMTNPVITINGDETIYVEYQNEYIELEAVVTDNYDQSCEVLIGGDIVDSSVLGTYEVTYNATDSSGNQASVVTRTVVVQDTTNPVITLIGNKTTFVEYEGVYVEPGTIITDNYDESSEVLIGGDIIDSTMLGSYIITYNTTDSNGNNALEITRTVIVQDTTNPFINLNGDEVVYIEYEDIYLELGAVFNDNYDQFGDVSVGGDIVDSSILGTYTVSYNAVDSNTNEAIEVIRTVIVQDTTSPVLILIGDEPLYVEYGDSYIEQSAIFMDNYDEFGEVVVGGEEVNMFELGTYIVEYNSIDSNGNLALVISRTVIVQDTTSPVITINGDETVYLDYDEVYIELGAIFNDNFDGLGNAIVGGDVVDSSTEGIYYISYNYTDSFGNQAEEQIRRVVVGDVIPPVIGNIPVTYTIDRGDNANFIDLFDITVIDDIDGNLIDSLVINYMETMHLQPGSYSVVFEATDFSGNEATESMVLVVSDDSSNLAVDLANLVVFIRFSDETNYTSPLSYSQIDNIFNDNNVSVQDYYLEVSNNDFNIFTYFTNDSIVFYTDSYSRGYYEPYDSNRNIMGYQSDEEQKEREYVLLKSAIDYIEDNNLIDPSVNLDVDNDGEIDNTTFLVSNDVGEWRDLLWPHRYSLWDSIDNYGDFKEDAPSINGDYAFTYTFQLLGNKNNVSPYFSLGVLAHELFHVLGAPDLYHYYLDEEISPVGYWDIMDNTNSIPNHMLLYMKEEYGGFSQDLLEVTTSGTYSFNVSTSLYNNGIFIDLGYSNEFLYMEYRDNVGDYESSLVDDGIIFYRVDQDFTGNADGMYVEEGYSEDEIFVFREGMTFDSTYLVEDRYVVEDDGDPDDAVMNTSTFSSIGAGTSIPMFYSDGVEIDITISLISISNDDVKVVITIN